MTTQNVHCALRHTKCSTFIKNVGPYLSKNGEKKIKREIGDGFYADILACPDKLSTSDKACDQWRLINRGR